MPTEQKIVTSSDESQELSEQIDELETLLQKSESLRKKQFLLSACALLSMILILTLAILNLTNFFRNYPKNLLMREVFFHSRPLLYTPWNIRGNTPQERRILKQTAAELEKTLKEYLPQIRHSMRQSVRSLKRYTHTELRSEFQKHLYTCLQIRAVKYMNENKIHPDRTALDRIRIFNTFLAESITEKVFAALQKASLDQASFLREANLLYSSGAMEDLKKEPRKILEERFLSGWIEMLQTSPDRAIPAHDTGKKGDDHL